MNKQNTAEAIVTTPWFPPSEPPVHVGPYEVMIDGEQNVMGRTWFAYWNGSRFGYRAFTADEAVAAKSLETCLPPHAHWRGVRRGRGRPPKSAQ